MTYMIEKSLNYTGNVFAKRQFSTVLKITPKFLTELAGSKNLPAKEIEDEDNLERCRCTKNDIFSLRWI